MTYRELIKEGEERLTMAAIPEPQADALELFFWSHDTDRAWYYAHMNDKVAPGEELLRYMEAIDKRSERVPIQRITGEREFMGYPFYVKDCLIPRQDTEVLVCEALDIISTRCKDDPVRLLDMCTGSGCIPISIIKSLKDRYSSERSVEATGVDISRDALATACENRNRNGIDESRLEFVLSDLFKDLSLIDKTGYDIITCNPPYIPTRVIDTLEPEVRDNDPFIALDGGPEGMDLYDRILPEARSFLKSGGYLILEIGSDQGKKVTDACAMWGYRDVRLIKDMAGLDRVVTAVK